MVVESLQRLGTGTLYEEYLRRRAKLQAQGLFDPARKRPLPPYPRALGVVTSLGAAALRDVLSTLQRRAPQLRVIVYPSPVQGAEAPDALVRALQLAGERREVDALLLVRGGGSLEDLWAFNDERVVRAVAACTLPVVCGVGHETDLSLCDLAADLRAPTPTAAAELAAPARDDLLLALQGQRERLRRAAERALQGRAQRLDSLALRIGQPARALRGQAHRLQQLAHRLQHALALQLQSRRLRLQVAAERLQAQDPSRVLQRGYAWIESADGRPVVSARALSPGQTVRAVWADGRATAQIEQVEPLPPAP